MLKLKIFLILVIFVSGKRNTPTFQTYIEKEYNVILLGDWSYSELITLHKAFLDFNTPIPNTVIFRLSRDTPKAGYAFPFVVILSDNTFERNTDTARFHILHEFVHIYDINHLFLPSLKHKLEDYNHVSNYSSTRFTEAYADYTALSLFTGDIDKLPDARIFKKS